MTDTLTTKLEAMRTGGKILGLIRQTLWEATVVGATPVEIESLAQQLIKTHGAEVSFDKVPRYHWATCITINEQVVHGIPTSTRPFADGDLVMVDVGVYYQGYHTDSAFTKIVGTTTPSKLRFLEAGRLGLKKAISTVRPGAHIGAISAAMESTLKKYGYKATRELTGHGVGEELHMEPMIPNIVVAPLERTPVMYEGQTLALEIIYVEGSRDLVLEDDGWTISTKDGKLSAVFEETVEVTHDGYSILTKPTLFQMPLSGTIEHND